MLNPRALLLLSVHLLGASSLALSGIPIFRRGPLTFMMSEEARSPAVPQPATAICSSADADGEKVATRERGAAPLKPFAPLVRGAASFIGRKQLNELRAWLGARTVAATRL